MYIAKITQNTILYHKMFYLQGIFISYVVIKIFGILQIVTDIHICNYVQVRCGVGSEFTIIHNRGEPV